MTNFDTVRLALTFDGWTPDDDEHRRWVAKALAALARIEADHFTSADMADAQAKAFRAGVASVQQGVDTESLRLAGLTLIGLAEHDQHCEVFDLDDEGKHRDCNCGLADAIATITHAGKTAAPVAQQPRAYHPEETAVREACDILTNIRDAYDSWGGWSGTKQQADKAINLLRYGSGAQSAQQPQAEAVPVCTTCKGEGGWEQAHSSTNYSWVKCADCTPQQAEAVPPGFVLVPVEPTAAMARAWLKAEPSTWLNSYRAMLEAAQGAKT